MNRFSRGVIITLMAILAGCSDGKLEDKKGDLEVKIQQEGKKTVVSISQNVDLFGYFKENKKPDFRVRLRYTPVRLVFTDYPNMPELPRPLPLSLAPPNNPKNQAIPIPQFEQKLAEMDQEFTLPYRIRGKTRVNDSTLDLLVASNQIERVEQYSLDNVSVIFSTSYAWKVTKVDVYKSRASAWDEPTYRHHLGFSLEPPDRDPKSSVELAKKGGYRSDQYFFVVGSELDKAKVYELRKLFDDEKIKTLTDEMIWQIAYVEAIEGLFPLIDQYENGNPRRVTHFAVDHVYDFGIGQTFETTSEARTRMLSSFSKSESEAGARYTVHLGGIIAAPKDILEP